MGIDRFPAASKRTDPFGIPDIRVGDKIIRNDGCGATEKDELAMLAVIPPP